MSTSPNEQDFIQLNAYLDGELSGREREAFELRLADDVGLRRELDALRVTVSLVGMAERVPVPRNFTLDPAVYGRPAPKSGLLSGFWPTLSTAGAALSTLLLCVGLLLFAAAQGGGFMMAPPPAEEALEEAAQLEMPAEQAFEEPVEEQAAEEEAEEEAMEEAPMAMEAAPTGEEAPAEEEMAVEEPAPELEAEEEIMPTPSATGMGGGMPPEEAAEEPAAPAEESAADEAEGELAAPSPTFAPLPTVEMDDGAAADRAAVGEENGVGAAEAPQQTQIAQEPVDTYQRAEAAAEVEPPTRSKFAVAPLPVFLLVIGGLGLAASLFGLLTSQRRRR